MLVEIFLASAALVCVIINIILLFAKDTPKEVCFFGIWSGLCAFLSIVFYIFRVLLTGE